ncbi:hypothetical protein SADUNF_Sadunf05G0042400 [Salix dunnii]|uniref:Uncharacterized protein n=1 Tax=Salix dunnii TaxID=1413687 RepID=A0A835K9I9_9ROSI|nr:hypothetical protein SADUNF_Sadunf05G0042400 [Salix dunnii]
MVKSGLTPYSGSLYGVVEVGICMSTTQMVIPPPLRLPRVTRFLKSYVLKMHFANNYVLAQVFHSPSAMVASSASSQEKALRSTMENA